MAKGMRPIYEWRWRDKTTRNPRTAAMYKRAAAKLGGKVTRYKVGFTLPASTFTDA